MKKKLVFLLLVLTSTSFFCQENKDFKGHVEILKQEISENYITPSSILFVYEGSTHSINYYRDLTEKIRRSFKKRLKKEYKNLELKFNYNLKSKKPLKQDLVKIPKKKYSKKLYEKICHISISKFKGWDNHLIENRKQNYNLNIELVDSKTSKKDLSLLLDIYSTYTIATQNKNSAKIIVSNILQY